MAGLSFDNYGGDWAPLPFVDRPHERTHQHRTFLNYLARQIPPPEQHPNLPDVDIRDSAKEYLVEIEVPGVKSTSEITVRWTSTSGLVVQGTVERPGWGGPKLGMKKQQQPVHANGENGHVETSHASEGSLNDEALVVEERRLGPFRRHINFPIQIEAKDVKAKLEAGLLTLRIPKATHVISEHDINVEITS